MMLIIAVVLLESSVIHGQLPEQFFQLAVVGNNASCLQIPNDQNGNVAPCRKVGGFTPNAVFLVSGNQNQPHSIQITGTSLCLDREHCHSSFSNLCYSDCTHCGAIHWSINSQPDGSVVLSEDGGNNCIFNDTARKAPAIHHCSDGKMHFKRIFIGNQFQLKSSRHGDCVNGAKFFNCSTALTFYTTNKPEYYSIHDYRSKDKCLDQEDCHSATSNVQLSDCSHCGAIHWSIYNGKVGEDGKNNCVNRGSNNELVMKHCSDGHEELYYSIIPNKPTNATDVNTSDFPTPDVTQYLQWDLSQKIRGVRLYRTLSCCQYTFELEIVHYLPNRVPYNWRYSAEFMITRIQTNINFTHNSAMHQILDNITVDNILKYDIQYGMVDYMLKDFTWYDGLYALFLTNPEGVQRVSECEYTSTTISQLKNGTSNSAHDWNEYYYSTYNGKSNDQQMYCDFLGAEDFTALYWPEMSYSRPRVKRKPKEQYEQMKHYGL